MAGGFVLDIVQNVCDLWSLQYGITVGKHRHAKT